MRPLLILILAVAIAAAQNPRPGGGSGGGGGAQGPTGPAGPTGPSGLSLPTAQPVTSGVTTSVTVPYNTTLTDLSQAVPSCTNGSGVGNAAWTTATGNSTQMVISFSGTTTANFTGSCTAILSIGATGPTGPTGPAGGGGISGLTTGTIPKAASSTTLNDSSILQSGTNIFVNATAAVGEFLVGSSATSVPRGITSGQFNTGTDSARFSGYKARGTQASPTTVVTGDLATRWSGFPYDGSNYLEAASIVFGTEGTIAVTRTPTYMSFMTGTNATPTVLTEAMRIDSSQRLLVTNNAFFNGAPGAGSTTAISNAVLPSIYFGSATGTQGATNYSYGDGIMNTLSGELSFRISNSSKAFIGANGVRAGATQSIGTKFAASGCSNGTTVGGATAGRFVSGTTGTCTVTITMGDSITSANGWHCTATNRTTLANLYTQSGDSTTTTTLTGTTVTGDVISFSCVGY